MGCVLKQYVANLLFRVNNLEKKAWFDYFVLSREESAQFPSQFPPSEDTTRRVYLVFKHPEDQTNFLRSEWITIREGDQEPYTYRWEEIGDLEIDFDDYEQVENKATDFTTVNDVKYPTVKAVKDYTDGTFAMIGNVVSTVDD